MTEKTLSSSQGQNLTQFLFEAIKANQASTVKQLILAGADLDAITDINTPLGETALHFAAQLGFVEIIEVLIEGGANPNAGNSIAATPLHVTESATATQVLISSGADVEATNQFGNTALHVAARFGPVERLEALLEAGASVETIDAKGRTPLLLAELGGNPDIIHALRNTKPVNPRTEPLILQQEVEARNNALLQSIILGDISQVGSLLKDGGDMSGALTLAIENHDLRATKQVLLFGANIENPNAEGRRPLHVAAAVDAPEIVELLLEHGADISATDVMGNTAYGIAKAQQATGAESALRGDDIAIETVASLPSNAETLDTRQHSYRAKLIQILAGRAEYLDAKRTRHVAVPGSVAGIEIRKLIDAAQAEGISFNKLLFHALNPTDIEVLKYLIDRGADVNTLNDDGATPLFLVHNREQVLLLVEAGANVNASASGLNGATALHLAAFLGKVEQATALIEFGASLKATDTSGLTPHDYARTKGHEGSMTFLDPIVDDKLGDHPVIRFVQAIGKHDVGTIEHLIPQFTQILNKPFEGVRNQTILHFAAGRGTPEIVKVLLQHGADPTVKDGDGYFPLDVAIHAENMGVVELLQSLTGESEEPDFPSVLQGFFTSLMHNDIPAIQQVIERYPEIITMDQIDDDRDTFLHATAVTGTPEALKLIVRQFKNVNPRNRFGQTPLHYAASRGKCKNLQVLVNNGANLEARTDAEGATPFHLATLGNSLECMKVCVELGANVHATDNKRNTALHHAANSGTPAMIDFLIKAGLSPDSTNNDGFTALKVAQNTQNHAVIPILQASRKSWLSRVFSS